MRVTNVVRDKIDMTLEKQYSQKITELYADKRTREAAIKKELEEVINEANAKARAILAKCPDAKFVRYGNDEANFIQDTAYIRFANDDELDRKAAELKQQKKELAMDLEIRCALEKSADDFFKMLADARL